MASEPFDEKQPNIQKKYIVCSLCNNNKTDEQNSAALRGTPYDDHFLVFLPALDLEPFLAVIINNLIHKSALV